MHTLLVIGVFAAMVLTPCVVASYPRLFSSSEEEPDTRKEAPAPVDAAAGPPSRRG